MRELVAAGHDGDQTCDFGNGSAGGGGVPAARGGEPACAGLASVVTYDGWCEAIYFTEEAPTRRDTCRRP